MNRPRERAGAPEWITTAREDSLVHDELGQGWTVHTGPLSRGFASTDFGSCSMVLPSGDSPAAQAVRAHELIHAAISPTGVPADFLRLIGVSTHAISLAEECRVNGLMRSWSDRAIPTGDEIPPLLWEALRDGSEKQAAELAVAGRDWKAALNVFLATLNTGSGKLVRRHLNQVEEWREPLDRIRQRVNERMLGMNAVFTEPYKYTYYAGKPRPTEQTTVIPRSFAEYTIPLAIEIERWLENSPNGGDDNLAGLGDTGDPEWDMSDKWDQIRLGPVELSENTGRFIGRRKRPALTGKIPRRPDRLITDPERRIFREEVRANGGVVVFDCSGSMSVTHDQVKMILSAFTGATIIAYANHEGHRPNAWFLARNGRAVSETSFAGLPLYGGNGIDGPIVQYASKLRRTRGDFLIWVSDGYVTGKHDHYAEELARDMARIIVRERVLMIPRASDAVELVKRLRSGSSLPRGGGLTGNSNLDNALRDLVNRQGR